MMENNFVKSFLTPRGSKVYSISLDIVSTTPPGSNNSSYDIFYKPSIPSGLFISERRENDGE
jgi:hypothetical protein